MNTHILVVICVVGGSLAGALASVAVGQQSHREQGSAPATVHAAPTETSGVGVSAQSALEAMDIEELKRRVAAMERVDANAQTSEPSSSSVPPFDPIASREANIAAHKAAIASHMAEPMDPKWAAAAARSFESDLNSAAAKDGFEVRGVDCRMTTCVATVGFKTFADANRQYGELLHMRYGLNCTREVTLDDPSEQSASFETTVVYDCTAARAGDAP